MAQGLENIGKKDVMWSYIATIFMIGAGVILLPFILHKMPAETIGIWNIFQIIVTLIMLLDFGFRPSFARTVSYIFSGVKDLRREGVSMAEDSREIDYALLKGTIAAMKRFYSIISAIVFIILLSAGTLYFKYILNKYSGDATDAWIAWFLLIVLNSYNLFTLYYDALLLGKGYIRQSQQITIIGQAIYIVLAISLIYAGFGLSAIVGSQGISIVIRRILTYRVFFSEEMKQNLLSVTAKDFRPILQTITPNAVKIGLTQLGGFCVNKSAVLMGSAYLTLEQVACYGVTIQVMDILARCAMVPYQSFVPKLAQCRAQKDICGLKKYYLLNVISLIAVYLCGGVCWYFLGDWALQLIHSETQFVPATMLLVMLIISFLEHNHSTAAGFIMADNKIPFFIPSLISGAATVLLLYIFLGPLNWGIWGLILAPGIAQLAYQNWKWPGVVIRELMSID